VFGDWKSYSDASHVDSPEDLLVLGAGASYSQGDDEIYRSTIDARWEPFEKWTVFGAGFANYLVTDAAGDSTDTGVLAQLGVLATDHFEPYVRYDAAFFGNRQGNGNDRAQEISVGVNVYPRIGNYRGSNFKVTFDLSYLPDGSPVASPNLAVERGDGEQWLARAQVRFQL
jgi:hypothetical protein